MYKDLFTTFFRIGAFTIGGGYAMIPLIEADVVEKHRWLDKEMFMDLVAVAQTCPGVFAVNISIFVGKKVGGFAGALMSTLGTVLPSLIIPRHTSRCRGSYSITLLHNGKTGKDNIPQRLDTYSLRHRHLGSGRESYLCAAHCRRSRIHLWYFYFR